MTNEQYIAAYLGSYLVSMIIFLIINKTNPGGAEYYHTPLWCALLVSLIGPIIFFCMLLITLPTVYRKLAEWYE